ncbi:hypothetical protein V8G54_030393 [Vigna mungo]|uniref:Uncharacterized protein n=1 Tax=Vigna mungo TaxID=3915 RepID=A0AAQ3MWC1_VIGMU
MSIMLGLFDWSFCKQAIATVRTPIKLSIEHVSLKMSLSIHSLSLLAFSCSLSTSKVLMALAHNRFPSLSIASFPEISSSNTTPKENTSIFVETTPSARYSGAM